MPDVRELVSGLFESGDKPTAADFELLFTSVFFPEDDTSERLAVPDASAAIWDDLLPGLPRDAAGRLMLQGMVDRLLTYAPAMRSMPTAWRAVQVRVEPLGAGVLRVHGDLSDELCALQRVILSGGDGRFSGAIELVTVEQSGPDGSVLVSYSIDGDDPAFVGDLTLLYAPMAVDGPLFVEFSGDPRAELDVPVGSVVVGDGTDDWFLSVKTVAGWRRALTEVVA